MDEGPQSMVSLHEAYEARFVPVEYYRLQNTAHVIPFVADKYIHTVHWFVGTKDQNLP